MAGWTYDLRQTTLVFPSRRATASSAAPMFWLARARDGARGNRRNDSAASTVPAQVRKSLAVNASPPMAWMY